MLGIRILPVVQDYEDGPVLRRSGTASCSRRSFRTPGRVHEQPQGHVSVDGALVFEQYDKTVAHGEGHVVYLSHEEGVGKRVYVDGNIRRHLDGGIQLAQDVWGAEKEREDAVLVFFVCAHVRLV